MKVDFMCLGVYTTSSQRRCGLVLKPFSVTLALKEVLDFFPS